MEPLNRLRITFPILIAGSRCDAGDVIEVDNETAFDLLNLGRAEVADEATAARFKSRLLRSTWRDPAEERERKPILRVIKNAA